LAKAIAALREGDLLLVTRLDRLARSPRDLLNVLDAVAKRGAGFKSLGDPLIDTSSAHGKLIIAILGALAEFEKSRGLRREGGAPWRKGFGSEGSLHLLRTSGKRRCGGVKRGSP
jgi:DNA invertase Pin-like site-specific DNA recombinase